MKSNNIIISSLEREEIIREYINSQKDEDLIIENANITEDPRCVKGKFPEEFLSLPKEVTEAVIHGAIKSFPIFNGDSISNEFYFFMNGPRDIELVKKGYEKVINAKLKDAKYFYDLDKKKKLLDRTEDLTKVVFIQKLGFLSEKIKRMLLLCELFKEYIDIDKLKLAINLSKVDLTTKLVSELPELQGKMGSIYARIDCIDEEIATSINDHYLPRGEGDILPASLLSMILSIIDRLDTLVGAFLIKLEISGSSDPLGLRRTTNGLIRILMETEIDFNLSELFDNSEIAYSEINNFETCNKTKQEFTEYFNSRVKSILGTIFRYDVINSVINSELINPAIYRKKSEVISTKINEKSFKTLCETFTRIKNITKNFESIIEIDESIFVLPQEKNLINRFKEINESYFKATNLKDKFNILLLLNEPVTNFFDDILIMCDDINLRNSRLSLISKIKTLIGEFADFSQITFEGG